jgi:hypothetical protein
MWSQYGDSHKGVCIAFDRPELMRLVQSAYDGNAHDSVVTYTNQMDRLNLATSLEHSAITNGSDKDLLDSCLPIYAFTKHLDYRDENEYRIAILSDNDVIIDCGTSIKAVILGDRFPSAYAINILDASKRLGIEVCQLKWINGNPELNASNL